MESWAKTKGKRSFPSHVTLKLTLGDAIPRGPGFYPLQLVDDQGDVIARYEKSFLVHKPAVLLVAETAVEMMPEILVGLLVAHMDMVRKRAARHPAAWA